MNSRPFVYIFLSFQDHTPSSDLKFFGVRKIPSLMVSSVILLLDNSKPYTC